MLKIIFQGIKLNELDLTNKLEGQQEIEIEQRASFNVKYANDNSQCAATLTIDMMEKNKPMDFNFKISATAFFACAKGVDKKEIHKLAYDEVFPHVRAMVANILLTSGLPPIFIPKADMEEANIELDDGSQKLYS